MNVFLFMYMEKEVTQKREQGRLLCLAKTGKVSVFGGLSVSFFFLFYSSFIFFVHFYFFTEPFTS